MDRAGETVNTDVTSAVMLVCWRGGWRRTCQFLSLERWNPGSVIPGRGLSLPPLAGGGCLGLLFFASLRAGGLRPLPVHSYSSRCGQQEH